MNFSSGETSETVTVSITDDDVVEANERFAAIIQRNSSDPISTYLDRSTFSIVNDDSAAPVTSYSMTPPAEIREGDGAVTFTVTRSETAAAETLYASTIQGAGLGYDRNTGDYAKTVFNQPVRFAAGEAEVEITVVVTDDDEVEGPETFGIILQENPGDPPELSIARADWTILDNETVATSYRIAGPGTVREDAGTVSVTVHRSGALPEERLYLSTVNGAALGYDTNAGDYGTTLNNFVLDFAEDAATARADLQILNDAAPEATEGFGVILQRAATDPPDRFLASTDWAIQDDDQADVSYRLSGPVRLDEDAGTIRFTVTRDGRFDSETLYARPIAGAANGLDTNAGDFALPASSIPVRFGFGEDTAPVEIRLIDDATPEAAETYALALLRGAEDPDGAAIATRRWTIEDDDAPPKPGPEPDLARPFIVELVHLAQASYEETSTAAAEAAGWTPVIIPGRDTAISERNTYGLLQSNVHFYEADVDGERTLAVAFSGTQPGSSLLSFTDFLTQIGNWDNLYRDQKPAILSVLDWAENGQPPGTRPFDKLVVTGHSLGGILTEEMLSDPEILSTRLGSDATGVTFGSSGSPTRAPTDRIINFVTLGDPVPMLHSGDFFGIEPAAESRAEFALATVATPLNFIDAVPTTVSNQEGSPALEAAADILEEIVAMPSREGASITMLRTADNVFGPGAFQYHFLESDNGYIDSIEQISRHYGSAFRDGHEDLDFWLSDGDGWHFIREPDALDMTVAFLQGLGFGALNLTLDKVRLVVGVIDAASNALETIGNATIKALEIGADGVARAWGSVKEFFSGTIDTIGTTLEGAGEKVEVFFEGLGFGSDDMEPRDGSAILAIDTDGDGNADLETTLAGEFDLDRFFVVGAEAGTRVFYAEEAQLVSSDLADILVGDDDGQTIWGDSGNDALFGLGGHDALYGGADSDSLYGDAGNDRLVGDGGDDALYGGDGTDTLNGGDGADVLIGGTTDADLRDVIFGGAGNDSVDGSHGNDELWGGDDNDTMAGGFGTDTIRGQDGDDVLTGSAFSDLLFGNDGFDFVNGGFGSDRVNGGADADRFFHVGVAGHGSDWIQDFSHAEGDRLVWGGGAASESQFQVNIATTAGAGDAGTDEAFVIYRPTGQILWALVDGAGEASIDLQIGGTTVDLLA